jgi:transposase
MTSGSYRIGGPKATYRQRNIIERVIGWYKEYRSLGTRHEKLAGNYVKL